MSSELTLELTPDTASVVVEDRDMPVRATSQPLGTKHTTAVGECRLLVGTAVIRSGTVRSFYIEAPDE